MTTAFASSLQTVTNAFDLAQGPGRSSGVWTMYFCPVHEGDGGHHRPSLGVKHDHAQHRTIVRCFANCDWEMVLDSVGLHPADTYDHPRERDSDRSDFAPLPRGRDRLPTPAERAIDHYGLPLVPAKPDLGAPTGPRQRIATYDYQLADGRVAGRVTRVHIPHENGYRKDFPQHRRTATGWEPGAPPKVLWKLPEILPAVAAGHTIWVCEGEEDVKAARALGLHATCNSGGSSAWTPEHAKWLAGARRVVVVADFDTPGLKAAGKVVASLTDSVGEVRVVRAATGNDLRDHLSGALDLDPHTAARWRQGTYEFTDATRAAAHAALSQLVPVPYLDPHTPSPDSTGPPLPESDAAPNTAPEVLAPAADLPGPPPAVETATAASVSDVSEGEPVIHEPKLFQSGQAGGGDQSADIDHITSGVSALARQVMQLLILLAQRDAAARTRRAEAVADAEQSKRAELQARYDNERAAAEATLKAMAQKGFANCTKHELANAARVAGEWFDDSALAKKTLGGLSEHISDRYGIDILSLGDAARNAGAATPDLAQKLTEIEKKWAATRRVDAAHQEMITLITAEQGLTQEQRAGLLKALAGWQANPSKATLTALTEQMKAAKLGEHTRTRVEFVALYLGDPAREREPDPEQRRSLSAVARKLVVPLVHRGESVKPTVDTLLVEFQKAHKEGDLVTAAAIGRKLRVAVNLLRPDDQKLTEERGRKIVDKPGDKFSALWPGTVDRVELEINVRAYATLAVQAEQRAAGIDDSSAADLRKLADKKRKRIVAAIESEDSGLSPLEKQMLRMTLGDIDAGTDAVPQILFADLVSLASADAERSNHIAHGHASNARTKIEAILDTETVPTSARSAAKAEMASLTNALVQLGDGAWSTGDFDRNAVAEQFEVALTLAGVPEEVREAAGRELAEARARAATLGATARSAAETWSAKLMADPPRQPAPAPAPLGVYDTGRKSREEKIAAHMEHGLSREVAVQYEAAYASSAYPLEDAVAAATAANGKTTNGSHGHGVSMAHSHEAHHTKSQGLSR